MSCLARRPSAVYYTEDCRIFDLSFLIEIGLIVFAKKYSLVIIQSQLIHNIAMQLLGITHSIAFLSIRAARL